MISRRPDSSTPSTGHDRAGYFLSQYGHESLWRDTVTTGAERARDLAARLERRAKVADEIAARDAYLGLLDIVVNYAGVAGGGPVHMVSLEEFRRVTGVNLDGTLLVCKHAVVPMMEQRSGSIVNIASVEGIEGTEGGSAYNASKGAVVLLTKNMAIDYGRLGIRVNCICPGFIDTPMFRTVILGGMGDIADGRQQRRVDQRRAQTEEHRSTCPRGEPGSRHDDEDAERLVQLRHHPAESAGRTEVPDLDGPGAADAVEPPDALLDGGRAPR